MSMKTILFAFFSFFFLSFDLVLGNYMTVVNQLLIYICPLVNHYSDTQAQLVTQRPWNFTWRNIKPFFIFQELILCVYIWTLSEAQHCYK